MWLEAWQTVVLGVVVVIMVVAWGWMRARMRMARKFQDDLQQILRIVVDRMEKLEVVSNVLVESLALLVRDKKKVEKDMVWMREQIDK